LKLAQVAFFKSDAKVEKSFLRDNRPPDIFMGKFCAAIYHRYFPFKHLFSGRCFFMGNIGDLFNRVRYG